MDYQQVIESITPEAYENLKTAVETGRWPDGNPLSQRQRAFSLQAIIAYESKHLPPEQRTGYVAPKPAGSCSTDQPEKESPVRWKSGKSER